MYKTKYEVERVEGSPNSVTLYCTVEEDLVIITV